MRTGSNEEQQGDGRGLRWILAVLTMTLLGSLMLAQEPARRSPLDSAAAIGSEMADLTRQGLGAADEAARQQLTPLLAGWIADFRDDAIDRGVEEIPADIREALSGFVPADVLDSVRWRIDGNTGFVGRALFQMSSAYAVTLDNVIIFDGIGEASDAGLWAHEIFHVMQYREWGIHGFVTRYLADHGTVEHEAKEFQYRWWEATQWHDGHQDGDDQQ